MNETAKAFHREVWSAVWSANPATPAQELGLREIARRYGSMFSADARLFHYQLAYDEAMRYRHQMLDHIARFAAIVVHGHPRTEV